MHLKKMILRKFIFAVIAVVGLGAISCSPNNQKNEEKAKMEQTAQVEEEEIGCLCCPVAEAPADSLDVVAPIP